MSRTYKICACFTFILALLFFLFFQTTKHDSALSAVNPFVEDPYDAVGSFAVQFTLLTVLIALIRAFRPYPTERLENQRRLFTRTAYLSSLSVAITLIADIVALLRHISLWYGSSAGQHLLMLLLAMFLATAFAIGYTSYATRHVHVPGPRNPTIWAVAIALICILVLALYPEGLRDSIAGELLTVFVGMLYLFLPILAIAIAISPAPENGFEDFIDDLTAIYRWLKAHSGPFAILYTPIEKVTNSFIVHSVLHWLNPRRYPWNLPVLLGVLMGVWLLLAEVFGEGGGIQQINRFVLIAAIFIGLEGAAVLLGYALLARPLGLFRRTAEGLQTHSQQ